MIPSEEIKNQSINCLQTISNMTDTEFDNEELCAEIIANTIEKMIKQHDFLTQIDKAGVVMPEALGKTAHKAVFYGDLGNGASIEAAILCGKHNGKVIILNYLNEHEPVITEDLVIKNANLINAVLNLDTEILKNTSKGNHRKAKKWQPPYKYHR